MHQKQKNPRKLQNGDLPIRSIYNWHNCLLDSPVVTNYPITSFMMDEEKIGTGAKRQINFVINWVTHKRGDFNDDLKHFKFDDSEVKISLLSGI